MTHMPVQRSKISTTIVLILVCGASDCFAQTRRAEGIRATITSSELQVQRDGTESTPTLEETEAWLKGSLTSLKFGTVDINDPGECRYFVLDADASVKWENSIEFGKSKFADLLARIR